MAQKRAPLTLVEGAINELPQIYNPTVSTGGTLHILATTKPQEGTHPLEFQSPHATKVAFRITVEDAIDLAVQISQWAEIRGVRLPKGVLYRGELQ